MTTKSLNRCFPINNEERKSSTRKQIKIQIRCDEKKMVHNLQKDNQRARMYIDSIMVKIQRGEQEMTVNSLIRQTTIAHPVSPFMVKEFVQKYYIEEGLVKLDGEILKKVNK